MVLIVFHRIIRVNILNNIVLGDNLIGQYFASNLIRSIKRPINPGTNGQLYDLGR